LPIWSSDMKKMLMMVVLAAALALPGAAVAHEGHAHRVLGTITAINGNHITVKTTTGKDAMVMLDAKTKLTQGKNKLEASSLKVGDRIAAEGAEGKGMMTAALIKVGTAPASAAR
jgi:hypothetical protein